MRLPTVSLPRRGMFPVSLCACALLTLAGCWFPPFDPELSASQYTAEKLGSPVWGVRMYTHEMADGYYLPMKNPPYYDYGFWVVRDGSKIKISSRSFIKDTELNLTGDSYVTNDAMGTAAVVQGAAGPGWTSYAYIGADPSAGLSRYISGSTMGLNVSYPIGFGYSPVPAGTYDNGFEPGLIFGNGGVSLCLLNWDGTPGNFIAYQIYGDGQESFSIANANVILVSNALSTVGLGLPTGPCFGAINQANNGYQGALYVSSKMSDGKIATYRWTNPVSAISFPEKLPVGLRITGMLSDGRLLADTGDSLYVYNADGKQSFEIKTGDLRFAHEIYDGANSRWICVFTRTVYIPSSGGDDKRDVVIFVYYMETANLNKLAY